MNDAIVTIPLFAELCLDDFEPAVASKGAACHRNGTTHDPAGQRETRPREYSANAHSNASVAHLPPGASHTNTFLAGPENRTLAEAVHSLLHESPSPYNPLVLWGQPGTGKSHVARGIAQHWCSQNRRAVYTSGADFARSLASAVESNKMPEWRAANRSAAVFVLEEIAQLTGKQAALLELLHTIDAVCGRQGQVVITSRVPLDRLSAMPVALVARLVGGLVLQTATPGPAARLALVERFATLRGGLLSDAAMRLLAEELAVTAPELMAAVTELSVQSQLDGEPVTPQRVRSLFVERRGAVRPTVRSIASLAANYFGIKVAELTSPTRRRAVVQARNVAIYLSRQLAGKSLAQIGKFFGGRDHTTILHGYRMIESRSRTDPEVRQALSELRKLLAHG